MIRLNHQLYLIKGPHKDTNRVRTLEIKAFDIQDAENQAFTSGLKEIRGITLIPHPKPSERQIEYAQNVGIQILEEYSAEDVSALLSRYEMKDSDPNEGLIEFATGKGLFFSNYIGKTALYRKIFHTTEEKDRIAFFLYCVYRYISDDRHANLDTHAIKDVFYAFADLYIDNPKFIQSLNRYNGEDIKFFGKFNVGNSTYQGGSVDTIAFKTAREYLIDQRLISDVAPYRTKTKLFKTTAAPPQKAATTEVEIAPLMTDDALEAGKAARLKVIQAHEEKPNNSFAKKLTRTLKSLFKITT